jgi:hypothetical protein
MKKNKNQQNKEMKKDMAATLMTYMEGLNPKGQTKMSSYLESKMGPINNYFLKLQKKKKWRNSPIVENPVETINS